MSMESASAIYDELRSSLKGKGLNSLKNIKTACDLIVISSGVLNYSRVARVATDNYGGPKIQSVQNNPSLKRYIDARKHEYQKDKSIKAAQESTESNRTPVNVAGTKKRAYPTSNLDSRTKTYIDQLHTRLDLAEGRYQELRRWQEAYTRTNPIDIAQVIEYGPADRGELQIEYKSEQSQDVVLMIEAMKEVLKLEDYLGSIEVEEKDGKNRLTLKRPSGDHVIINPKQFAAIERLINGESYV